MSDTYIPEIMELDSYWQKAVEDAISDTLKDGKELSESDSEQFTSSVEEEEEEEQQQQEDSKPWTREIDGSPLENRPKSPDRPLLGHGSLEKMKKSQNSFNLEPMGLDEEFSESDDETPEIPHRMSKKKNKIKSTMKGRNHPLQRRNRDENHSEKITSVKDNNYFLDDKPDFRSPKGYPECTDAKNLNVERKLQLALAKRDILNENLKVTSLGKSSHSIKINGSAMQIAGKKKKSKQLLSPFIKFYLEVYGELCQKCTSKQIAEEAAKRWRRMNSNVQFATKSTN